MEKIIRIACISHILQCNLYYERCSFRWWWLKYQDVAINDPIRCCKFNDVSFFQIEKNSSELHAFHTSCSAICTTKGALFNGNNWNVRTWLSMTKCWHDDSQNCCQFSNISFFKLEKRIKIAVNLHILQCNLYNKRCSFQQEYVWSQNLALNDTM